MYFLHRLLLPHCSSISLLSVVFWSAPSSTESASTAVLVYILVYISTLLCKYFALQCNPGIATVANILIMRKLEESNLLADSRFLAAWSYLSIYLSIYLTVWQPSFLNICLLSELSICFYSQIFSSIYPFYLFVYQPCTSIYNFISVCLLLPVCLSINESLLKCLSFKRYGNGGEEEKDRNRKTKKKCVKLGEKNQNISPYSHLRKLIVGQWRGRHICVWLCPSINI